jgi:uncharacterized membrane protein YkvA (DUF1232 family)
MMNQNHNDFYKKIRSDIKRWIDNNTGSENKWSEYVLLAPDLFHLLVKLSLDGDVPTSAKLKLAAAIAYFISPLDLFPEMLVGPIGFLDDISISAYVLNQIVNEIDPQIVKRHWAGDKDILDIIKTLLINANLFLGSGLWNKLRKKFR